MNSAQQRALRKEVLLIRAAAQRIELAQRVRNVRASAKPSALIRHVIPHFSSYQGVGRGLELLRRHPWASSLASLVLSRSHRSTVRSAIRWGGLAILAWQTVRWLMPKQRKPESPQEHTPAG